MRAPVDAYEQRQPSFWWSDLMDRLSAYGIGIAVPSGWEAELSLQQDPSVIDADLTPASRELVVVHAANFWMSAERSDYRSEALQVIGPEDIFIALVEFDSAAARSRLFEHRGLPLALHPDDFSPAQLQRPGRGQAGLQWFFRSGGRAFCLHAVIGSYSLRDTLTPQVNRILSALTIE